MDAIDIKKVGALADHLLKTYYKFLRDFGVNPHVYKIDKYILMDVAEHYYRDVKRLRYFHKIDLIGCHKIAGYIAYWICRLRPIGVTDTKIYLIRPNTPKFINESFAIHYVCGRINAELAKGGRDVGIAIDSKTLESVLYGLKYRVTPGDSLALFFDMAERLSIANSAQGGNAGKEANNDRP